MELPFLFSTVKSIDVHIDPLCKQITAGTPGNQHHRLCVAVCRSSYFKNQIDYPHIITYPCYKEEVSFRTEEGMKKAAGKSYVEQMTRCHSMISGFPEIEDASIYISRAYLSNTVFVYRRDSNDGKIYLENLSVNISVVDELNSFDFVEY